MSDFKRLALRASNAATLDNLSSVLGDLRKMCGLTNIVYHTVDIEPPVLLTSDPDFATHYADNYATCTEPNLLSFDDVSAELRRFMVAMNKNGAGRHGMTLQISSPSGERALLSFTSNAPIGEWDEFRLRAMHNLQSLANTIHDRVTRISRQAYQ